MAEDKAGAAAAAVEDEEPPFEAPERGSADELLDAGAHAPIDAMRHSTAHVMAEAVLDLFPGAQAGHRARHRRRLLLRLRAAAPAHAGRPRGDRGPDARVASPPTTRSCAARCRSTRAARRRGGDGQAFKVEILDDLAAQGGGRPATPMPPDHVLRARAVQRPVQGPARRSPPATSARSSCSPSPARTGAATRSARCSSGSTARSGRRRRSSTRSCGGARRRRSATTASWASQLDLFSFHDVSPGLRLLAPQGPAHLADARDAPCASSRTGAATRRSPRRSSSASACGAQSGHWDLYRENMFLDRERGPDVQPQADELPGVDVHLPHHLRSYRDLPLRLSEFGRLHRNERSGHAVRAHARAPVHPGRRATSTSARTSSTDEIEALLGEVREAYGWFGLKPRFTFATKPDKAIGDPALWEQAEGLITEALDASGVST